MAAGQRIHRVVFKNSANNSLHPAIPDIVSNLGKNLGLIFKCKNVLAHINFYPDLRNEQSQWPLVKD
jgi:hypothetical protein